MVATNEYPVFDGGMTLTKDDLNALRTFLDVQDAVLGRLIGFGIAYGLDGAVAGGNVTVQPGFAIDQRGRGGVLAAATTLKLTASGERFSFVDPAEGGITPVLVVRDEADKAPVCDEDCESHAPMTRRAASIVLVAGRLETGLDTFATDPLLALTPMSATAKGVIGDFALIRKTISDRLKALGAKLGTNATQRLASLTLDGIEAVRVYKAAFLNQVLFATIEYARCRALRAAARLDLERTPGVALGWANNGSWDCRYRHAFVPSDGMAMALLGGGCGDPCSLLLDRVEAILDSYVEPSVPKPSEPGNPSPRPGGFHHCPPLSKKRWGVKVDLCKLQLPERIPDLWWEEFALPDLGGYNPFIDPLWDPPKDFSDMVLDPFERGTVGLLPTFGTEVEGTKQALEQFLGQWVKDPSVVVVTQDKVDQLSGFTPEAAAAIGDTVVLVADATGKVAGTGRIPVQKTLTEFGSAVQDAVSNATAAVDAVGNLQGTIAGAVTAQVGQQFEAFRATLPDLSELGRLRTELNALKGWRTTVDSSLFEMSTKTNLLTQAVFKTEVSAPVLTQPITKGELAAVAEAVKTIVATGGDPVEGVDDLDTILVGMREDADTPFTAYDRDLAIESMTRVISNAELSGAGGEQILAAKMLLDQAKTRYQQ